MNNELRKYLAYAAGELLLVILGILIALQIDSWNADRRERASLQAYLETIAANMREDLEEINALREQRYRHLEAGITYQHLRSLSEFTPAEIFAAFRGLVLANQEISFNANTSGYDALRASPVVGRLQGTGLDALLSSYYDTVGRTQQHERSHAEYVRASNIELMRLRMNDRLQMKGVEAYALTNPTALSEARFAELQPMYRAIIGSPVWESLLFSRGRVPLLVQLYDRLESLAQVFGTAVSDGSWRAVAELPVTSIDRWRSGEGPPVLIENGRAALETFWLGGIDSPGGDAFHFDAFGTVDGALRIQHRGNADWASVYLGVEGVDAAGTGRLGLDFSAYSMLEIEMRGADGGETLQVVLKDADYPDYQAPVGVNVTLEADWQTFSIPLSEFAPNDLSKLSVPLAFNFVPASEPTVIFVRNARYR